uniref:Protein kinase domain-containing protein n=1 Tax=Macrostomum lignano TaxID=282301 RepID=A0A1I8F662_9PLAT
QDSGLGLLSTAAENAKAAKQYGQCYAATNSTETAVCLCPKRLSTANVEGATVKQYCSKQHAKEKGLTSKNSTAFIGGYGSLPAAASRCAGCTRPPDGVYTAILALDSKQRLRQRDSQRTRYPTYQVLEATLKRHVGPRNFHTYPDIYRRHRMPGRARERCRLGGSACRYLIPNFTSKRARFASAPSEVEDSPLLSRGPLSGLSLDLRVLNEWNRMIGEARTRTKLLSWTFLLHDRTGAKGDRDASPPTSRRHRLMTAGLPAERQRPQRQTDHRLLRRRSPPDCSDRVLDSGFTADFRSTRPKGGLHMQTGGFPAFRLGNSPNLYFPVHCPGDVPAFGREAVRTDQLRVGQDGQAEPGQQCLGYRDGVHVWWRSSGTRNGRSRSRAARPGMCLSTRQVIVIILILLVLLALVSGLVIVVYRRRPAHLGSATSSPSRASSQDGGPSSSAAIAASAACRGGGAIGGVIAAARRDNDLDDLDEDVVGTPRSIGEATRLGGGED